MKNTVDQWVTYARILEPERAALWSEVFPDGVVPIESIYPKFVCVPERGECLAVMLDLQALTVETIDKICRVLSSRFGVSLDETKAEMSRGVPIVVDGVQISSTVGFGCRPDDWEEEEDYLDEEDCS